MGKADAKKHRIVEIFAACCQSPIARRFSKLANVFHLQSHRRGI
jgi:hypothetical protein